MAERATIARPYAKAAFAVAREQGRLAEWSRWLGNARGVVPVSYTHLTLPTTILV